MSKYSQHLYVRIVNPGTEDEYVICGPTPSEVSDTVVGDSDSVSKTVARYSLVGTGEIHQAEPMYVETSVR